MSTAIKLSTENLNKIATQTNRPLGVVKDDLWEADKNGETRYIIFDITMNGIRYPWLSILEKDFYEKYDWVDPERSDKICLA